MNELLKTTDEGIYIDGYIRDLMETLRTGGLESEQPKSSREIGAEVGISHVKWNELEKGQDDFASWGIWGKIYKKLVEEGLLPQDKIEYMPPTILRERLENGKPIKTAEKKEITKEEKEILYLFGLLNQTGRQTALATMKALASTSPLVDSQLVKKHTA